MTDTVPIRDRKFEPHQWRIRPPRPERRLTREELDAALQAHREWVNTDGASGERLMLIDCDLSELGGIRLDDCPNACLAGCRFRGSRIQLEASARRLDFTNADFRGSTWHASHRMHHCVFSGAIGLTGPDRVTYSLHSPILVPNSPTTFPEVPAGRFGLNHWFWPGAPAWDQIRALGDLPIFGISYIALSGVLVYAATAGWYNGQVAMIKTRASEFDTEHDGSAAKLLADSAAHLREAPRPWELGMLLVGLLLLAAGSTIYKATCPEVIQHYRLPQWTATQGRDEFEWQVENWSKFWRRKTCSVLYALGGAATLLYLIPKTIAALGFFLGF